MQKGKAEVRVTLQLEGSGRGFVAFSGSRAGGELSSVFFGGIRLTGKDKGLFLKFVMRRSWIQ